MFIVNDRVLAKTNRYEPSKTATVINVNSGIVTVELDEDHSKHDVPEQELMFFREEFRTDPKSANWQLICKNCGWEGGAHVWFAPHYCKEQVTRKSLMDRNEQPVPTGSVFEAHVIIPIHAFRPDGTEIPRAYIEGMKKFDPSLLKGVV